MIKSLLAISFLMLCAESMAQTEFLIEPNQSMIMTGKGPGQDATINPYFGQECYAVIENIGEREFSIRIQSEGKIKEEIPLAPAAEIKVKLLEKDMLFFDPNPKGDARARIDYEQSDE